MSGENVFGPWIDGWYVEGRMEDMLRRWIEPALQEVERFYGLEPGTIPRPVSWSHHNIFTKAMEDDTPHLVIVSTGFASRPMREGDGTYTAGFRIGVGAVVADLSSEWASQTAKAYLAAIRLAILKNRGLEDEGGVIQRTDWEDEKYDDIPASGRSDRNLATAQTVWTIWVRGIATDTPGPLDPPVPDEVPGNWPTVDPDKINFQLRKTPIEGDGR